MNQQPYLYDPQANILRQRGEPKCYCMTGEANKCKNPCDVMKRAYKPLPAYTPVSGWVPEVGKEYVAGVHFQVKGISSGFETETFISRVAVPIEQKQEDIDPIKKAKIDLIWEMIEEWQDSCDSGEKHVLQLTYNDVERDLYGWLERVDPKKEVPRTRVFSLQDMIECWEAGRKYGADECMCPPRGWDVDEPDMKQYFKSKFNTDLP